MPEEKNTVVRRWLLGSIAFFAIAIVVVFIWMAVAPRQAPETSPEGVAQNPGNIRLGPVTERALANETDGIGLAEYRFDPGTRRIEGSVMNSTNYPYVNVQVSFDLLQSDGSRIGEARDTARSIEPGGAWLFNIAIPENATISSVRPASLTGGRRGVVGPQSNPDVTQREAGRGGDLPEDNVRY